MKHVRQRCISLWALDFGEDGFGDEFLQCVAEAPEAEKDLAEFMHMLSDEHAVRSILPRSHVSAVPSSGHTFTKATINPKLVSCWCLALLAEQDREVHGLCHALQAHAAVHEPAQSSLSHCGN